MSSKEKIKIFKRILLIVAICLIVGMVIYMFPIMQGLFTDSGQAEYKDKVQNAGAVRNINDRRIRADKSFFSFYSW